MRFDKPVRVLWMSEDDTRIGQHLVSMVRHKRIHLKSFGSPHLLPSMDIRETKTDLVCCAELILAPITPEFMADEETYRLLQLAFERHNAALNLIMPVLLRPVSLKDSLFDGMDPFPGGELWLDLGHDASAIAWARVPEMVEASILEIRRRRVNAVAQEEVVPGSCLARASGESIMPNTAHSRHSDSIPLKSNRILREGDRVGQNYKLLARIGLDSVSTIWRAIDTRSGRMVTLRVIHDAIAQDWEKRRLVSFHTLALHEIGHPALIEVLQSLTDDGGVGFYVTQLFEGTPLRREALLRPLDEVSVLSLMLHVCRALDAVEKKGLAHGDIRPGNFLSDGSSLPKIADFPVLGGEEVRRQRGISFEAQLYTAPELSLPRSEPTPKSDVFSLARTAIFCLRGSELPEDGDEDLAALIQLLECANGMKAVIAKAADPEPDQRYPKPEAFCQALLDEYRKDRKEIIAMVDLEGGEFTMGDDSTVLESDKPEHPVKVSPFSMGKYPVTQRQYRQIMLCNPSYAVGEALPVNRVSFFDAVEMCNQLSEIEGYEKAYTISRDEVIWNRQADGYRLPTEAEWEYAARGPKGRLYPWGNEAPGAQLCWSGPGNDSGPPGRHGPSPVGTYADGATPGPDGISGLSSGAPAESTPDGIMDLAGNVWEWCWDWHDRYDPSGKPESDPCGPERPVDPPLRALRGAAWNEQNPLHVRAATRSREFPTARDPDIGFRVVRSLRAEASVRK